MSYRVAIQKVETGEVRFYEHEINWDENHVFQWLDGNYSCDCNRELFFDEAGDGEMEFDDARCSEGRFKALYAEFEDGTKEILDGRPGR